MVIDHHKGIYVPYLSREACNECGRCFEACPGHSVDFKQLNQEIFGKEPEDILLGNYLNCYIGHATDYDIRYNSASGGLVTALLVFALAEGMIDGALVTRMNKQKPLEPEPFVARTREEIVSASKSKYCPVPANTALTEILSSKEGEKFAVVGLPCHIHGVRKAEAVNKKLKKKLALHLGIFCGYPVSFAGTEFVLHRYGMNKECVIQLDYRGEGWPGYMTIQLNNGSRRLIPLDEYGIFQSSGFFVPWRCALCCEQVNQLPDISFGDAWLPELAEEKIGASVVISRSRIGEDLLQQAITKGKIALRTLSETRVRHMEGKRVTSRIRLGLARLVGKKHPHYYTESAPSRLRYPPSLLLYTNMLLSRRCLWWLIGPLAEIFNVVVKLGIKLLRLISLR